MKLSNKEYFEIESDGEKIVLIKVWQDAEGCFEEEQKEK